MGLSNIRTRVAAYNGNLLIDSKAGVGTEINYNKIRLHNSKKDYTFVAALRNLWREKVWLANVASSLFTIKD